MRQARENRLVYVILAEDRLVLAEAQAPHRSLARVTVLLNPANPSHFVLIKQTRAAAPSLQLELHVVEAGAPDLLDSAFAAISAAQSGALIVFPDAMFFGQFRA
jgi:ABC-type uncharacterized transport system substrate-binding protein